MIDQAALPPPILIQLDGTEIATYIITPDDTSPRGNVVLCHGTPWSAASWLPVARILADRYRVILWDMPGYGASIGEAAQ